MGGASGGGGRCPFAGGGGTPETPALCPLCHPGVPSMSPPTAQSPQPPGAPAPQYSPPMCHPGVPVSPLSMSPVPSPATQIPHLPRVHVPPLSPPLYPDVPCPPPCILSPHVPGSVSPVPPQPPESTLGSVSLLSPQVPWAPMSSVPLQSLLSSLCPLCHPRLPESPTPRGSLPPMSRPTLGSPVPSRPPFPMSPPAAACPCPRGTAVTAVAPQWPCSRWWASCRWRSGRRASTAATSGNSGIIPPCAPPSSPSCCDRGDTTGTPRGQPIPRHPLPAVTPGTPLPCGDTLGTPCPPLSPSYCDTLWGHLPWEFQDYPSPHSSTVPSLL